MQTRHRIPTIFSLYMVDVLCCSLGCVLLLWLVKLREANEFSEEAGQTNVLLTKSEAELKDVKDERNRLARRVASTEDELSTTRGRMTLSESELGKARTRLTTLDKRLATMRAQQEDLEDRLAKKAREEQELTKTLDTAQKKTASLEVLVRERDTSLRALTRDKTDMEKSLLDADARLKKLKTVADQVPDLEKEIKSYKSKLTETDERMTALAKDLDERKKLLAESGLGMKKIEEGKRTLEQELSLATRTLDLLKEEKKSLTEQISRARAAADHRFAGITLTGRRVVFLVDMSGSMELVDENTPAPDKWSGVRETLVKIMQSLPNLEQFQVIVFSDKTSYLLGQEGRWFEYEPQSSVERVSKALIALKPKGATNMYAAFDAAFRLRANGMDTIYLLSDGLPNLGEGLTPQQVQTLDDTKKGEILGPVVRRALKTTWNREGAGRPRVRINTIGFFYESPDVGAFLWALARENEGSFVGMSKP